MALTNIFNYFTGKKDSSNVSNNAFFDSVEQNEYHGDNEVQMVTREPGEVDLLDIKLNKKTINIKSVYLLYKKRGVYTNVYGFDFEIIVNSYGNLVLEITNIYEYAEEPETHRQKTPAFNLWEIGLLTKGDYITLDLNLHIDKPFNHKFEKNNRHMYHIIDNIISQTKSIKATITPKGQYRYHPNEEGRITSALKFKKDQTKAREYLKSIPPPEFPFGPPGIWEEHRRLRKTQSYGNGKYKQNNTKSKKSKKSSKSSNRRTSSRKKNKKKGKSNK